MKYFWIPCVILAAVFSLSLLNAYTVGETVSEWCGELQSAQQSADEGNWAETQRTLAGTYEKWGARQSYFHIVTVHAELDEVEALFAKSRSFALEQDEAEFRANTAELITQLKLLAEMQEISVKNIL
ncbi:MAG: DUF4363 family protein [Oscillospiraceae bacterium]|nr:DUF4363 family protein [Oscillospiraceae bacterium]